MLSARAGNYQYHPFWRLLIDQLWVPLTQSIDTCGVNGLLRRTEDPLSLLTFLAVAFRCASQHGRLAGAGSAGCA